MRYSKDEETVLVGIFPTDVSDVKIEILNLKTDTLVDVVSNTCVKSEHMDGVYLWNTNQINTSTLSAYNNLLYKMYGTLSNGKQSVYYGKFVYSGYVDKDLNVDLEPVLENQEEIKETVDIINARI